MRKLYWYISAYAKKHGLVFVASIVFAIIIFSVSISSIVSTFENKSTRYIGLVGSYTLETLPLQIKNKISAGLTKIEEDGTVVPFLAERFSAESDGKTFRFVIRQGLFYRDGKELKPEDISYAFNDVETIITPNDIVFKLPDAYAPFPTLTAEPIIRSVEERYYLFFSRPTLVGVGPFSVTDYKKNGSKLSEITIESKDEKEVYRFFLTEQDAINAFKAGEVDILPDISKETGLENWPNVNVTKNIQFNKYLAVFFNIRDPLFQKNVRQALAYSIEKPQDETRAIGPISPLSWAFLPAGKTYDKDMPRAIERILDELPPQKLNINFATTPLYAKEAEQIKKEWEEFGNLAYEACQKSSTIKDKNPCENLKITVNLLITNFPDTSSFQALLIGQESPSDPDQYALWHSEQSTNFTGYKNTRIDNLLEKGRQSLDRQERKEIYQEFQQFFLEDEPAIFIKHLSSFEVTRK